MSWFSPQRWAIVAMLAAALMAAVWRLDIARQQIGYDRAVSEYTAQAAKADEKREAIAAPIVAKEAAAQVQIRTVTKTIIEKVPVYVPLDSCPLPAGFRLLHDSAAANVELPDAPAIIDDSPVPAQDVATVVVENYGTCHATAARLEGLQTWVSSQRALKLGK